MNDPKGVAVEPVRVFCAANAAYAAPLCVMLTSMLINLAEGRKIEIYVLATNIPEEDRRKIEASLRENRSDFDTECLHWLSPNLEIIEGLHVDGWVTIETYARLLAPHILPEDLDKILHLDSDMVVLSDISPLYDRSCNGHALLAARDTCIEFVSSPYGVFNFAALGIPPETPYFNSGVMLVNLRYWREHKITEKILDYLKAYRTSVHFWDQGGMNALLYHSWTEIDGAWNQIQSDDRFHVELNPGRFISDWFKREPLPHIIHYTSKNKPWTDNRRPGYTHFFDYLEKTTYRTSYKRPHLERIIGFKLNNALWRAKIFLFWKRTPQDVVRVFKRLVSSK